MADGPWTKYQSQSTPADGPWTKYRNTAAPPPPASAPTLGQMSAGKPPSWLDRVESDLTNGGSQTIVGRILGDLQGRGSKGYSGLNSGVSRGAASFMGSPEIGTIHAMQGIQEIPSHPLRGLWDTAKGALDASQIPLGFMVGPGTEGITNLIPSAEHAASILDDISQAAHNTPVYMENSRPALQSFAQNVKTGGKNAPVITKLFRRIQNIAPRPSPEPEAIEDTNRLLGAGMESVPLGKPPVPGEMPGGLFPAKPFPPENVGSVRVLRNAKGQILPKASRIVDFPDASGKLPIRRNPFTGKMLPRTPMRKAWMTSHGEEVPSAPEFSGPGVLLRPKQFPAFTSPPTPEYDVPVMFPEARSFYTNISRVTKPPGFLRRAIESPMNPSLRRNAGIVRDALNRDLTDAANRVGRGNDYTNAMREYRNAKRLSHAARIARNAAIVTATEEAARHSGIFGHTLKNIVP